MREEINHAIRVQTVRAVFPDGSIAIMATDLAIRKAQRLGLDLVLIAPEADPPVAKAMNYSEWLRSNTN
jgi:translation initiation factor IF-3